MRIIFALHKFCADAVDAIQGNSWPSSAPAAPATLSKIPCFVPNLSARQGMNVAFKQFFGCLGAMVNGQDKKILIVEKQPNYTQQLVKQVMFAGMSPVVAVTGEGGIRKAIEHHPDLILLELDLTDMDGLRFVSLIRERESLQKTPIVAMSIVGQMKAVALKGGCNDFICKPVKMIELMAHIRQFIYGSRAAPMKTPG